MPTEKTVQELQEELRQRNQERAKACWAEIQSVLEQHGCTLVTVPKITQGGTIVADIVVTVAPPQQQGQ